MACIQRNDLVYGVDLCNTSKVRITRLTGKNLRISLKSDIARWFISTLLYFITNPSYLFCNYKQVHRKGYKYIWTAENI